MREVFINWGRYETLPTPRDTRMQRCKRGKIVFWRSKRERDEGGVYKLGALRNTSVFISDATTGNFHMCIICAPQEIQECKRDAKGVKLCFSSSSGGVKGSEMREVFINWGHCGTLL